MGSPRMCLKEAVEKLSSVITVRKRDLIASVVAARSNSVSILLENVHDEGNEGAVLRSMDALGCLSLHKLTTKSKKNMPHSPKKFKSQPRTDVGARCWVEVHQWSNTEECISTLKQRYGYSLATASPKAPTSIADIDFEQKWLIAFGNETEGISEELSELSDVQFSLPMCGFVESFNVSVSVALTLYHAYLYRISKHPTGGDLSEREKLEWTYKYYAKTALPGFKGDLAKNHSDDVIIF